MSVKTGMKLFCLFVIAMNSTIAFTATVRAPNAEVKYDGIDEKQAAAMAQTISAARKVYVEDFGFDMPGTIVAHRHRQGRAGNAALQ